ncbi:MAG TPA: hypothetical protein VEB42_00935, partial [Chitinophagaceae bacterium]|nr:hypothetical protein [Chitinophagaceae bacterium]
MKSAKLLFLLLITAIGATAQFNYVQQMAYRDYSLFHQVNIGKAKLTCTHPSAYLEIGDSLYSRQGLLFPRGKKDSVQNPTRGLVIFDIPSAKFWYHNGTAWAEMGAASNVITGTGTGGRLALWSSGNTLTSSQVRDDGSSVGIGIAPHAVYMLNVNGHGYFNGTIATYAGVHVGDNWKVMVDNNG